jgi:serine/threonine-protein kinase
MVGRIVDGRYRVERVLGEGGMGVVFLVTHVALKKRMAMKVLRDEMARDRDVVQRFIQEAQASTAIGHPNIIDISDFGRMPDGAVYFVMEYLEGESLTQRIERTGPLTVAAAVAIVEQIGSALAAAHAHGVIHRDMKPDNVFLIRRGEQDSLVKVLDFGIAKVGSSPSKLTRTGMVFGTPHYMAPEQAAGQVVDARADVYALGVIMYEMFTGVVPFDAETFMGILTKQMFEDPIPPTERGAPPDMGPLEPIVLRALATKPEVRYASMDALLRDLEAVRRGGRLPVTEPSAYPASAGGPAMPSARGSSAGPAAPKPRYGLYAVVGAVVLLAAGSGVGAIYALWQRAEARAAESLPPLALPSTSGASVAAAAPAPSATASPRIAAQDTARPAAGGPTEAAPPAPVPSTTGAALPIEEAVHLTSEPDGAVVLVDGAVVGETPLDLPTSITSSDHRIVLRRGGYQDEPLDAEDLVAGARLHVELEAAARVVRARRSRPSRDEPSSAAPAPEPPPAAAPARTTARRPFTEVVDPWGE